MTGNPGIQQDDPSELPPEETVEVELEGEQSEGRQEEGSEEPDQRPEKPDTGDAPRRTKPRQNPERRIGQLRGELGSVQRTAQELREELEQRRRGEADNASLALHYARTAVETQIKLAERDLKEAGEAGDETAKASLTSKLAKLHADLSRIPETPKPEERPAEAARPEQREQPREQPRQVVELPPAPPGSVRATWERQNPWFNPASEDHDPEMYAEARAYAVRLEARLRAQGRADEIGNDSYYKQIDRYVGTEFADRFELADEPAPKPQTRMPPMTGKSAVAAPTRSAPAGQQSSNAVRLTQDQQDMARHIYAQSRHKDGTPYSEREKMVAYATRLKNPGKSAVKVNIRSREQVS